MSRELREDTGMCTVCFAGAQGCPQNCGVWGILRDLRGAIYSPYGTVAGAKVISGLKELRVMGRNVGSETFFRDVDLSIRLGHCDGKGGTGGIEFTSPWFIAAIGSTKVGPKNAEALCSGWVRGTLNGKGYPTPVIVGENVASSAMDTKIEGGKVVKAPALERRIEAYLQACPGREGVVVVQVNYVDRELRVDEWVINRYRDEPGVLVVIEYKDGQGAKNIGGEIMVFSLEEAQELQHRGYRLEPDPALDWVKKAFGDHHITQFERHTPCGSFDQGYLKDWASRIRKTGAVQIWLKTGAWRPGDLANLVDGSCKAGIDVITFDAAGGGTGMSPTRMGESWGLPFVALASTVREILIKAANKHGRETLPSAIMAGGLGFEDHVFKALALGDGWFQGVAFASVPLACAMSGRRTVKQIAEKWAKERGISRDSNDYNRFLEMDCILTNMTYSSRLNERLQHAAEFRARYPEVETLSPLDVGGAVIVFSYAQRLAQCFQQFCSGSRARLQEIRLNDIAAMTMEMAEMSGAAYVMDLDQEKVDQILGA